MLTNINNMLLSVGMFKPLTNMTYIMWSSVADVVVNNMLFSVGMFKPLTNMTYIMWSLDNIHYLAYVVVLHTLFTIYV